MVSLKSEDLESSTPPTTSPACAQEELKLWENRAFTFDMDHEPTGSSRAHGNNQRSSSDSSSVPAQSGTTNRDAALLAQFAAAAASHGIDIDHGFPVFPPGQYPSMGPPPGFYGNFFHHGGIASTTNQLPPLTSMDFPWPHISPPPQHNSLPYHQQASPSTPTLTSPPPTFVPSPYPISPPPPQLEASTSRDNRGLSVSSTEDMTEAERAAMSEEKRRRNTAASARFRIKKKQKTINLERSVSDLTGRAEELEREVSDLRRENGWLKEIVMLKGTRFTAANLAHRMALNEASASAVGGQQGSAEGSSQQRESDPTRSNLAGEFSEDETESSDDETAKLTPSKGKNKADSSGKRK